MKLISWLKPQVLLRGLNMLDGEFIPWLEDKIIIVLGHKFWIIQGFDR